MTKSKTSSDTPEIHCGYSKLVKIEDVRANPKNYNKHPDVQIALLSKNIRELGWRHPIIVSKRSGLIVSGHARLEAGKMLNLAKVPVEYQDYASEAEELAVVVADNRIAELAEPDASALKDILLELDAGNFDMDLTGFLPADLATMMDATMPPVEPDASESTVCPKCGYALT